ncbi:hypothetical protein E4T56_gene10251 [Termitomyces sp. T112]|nr:hypothetical protein E4T56_gene10251 [Termitomyces sp. T112]
MSYCHDPSPETPHIVYQPPTPKKTPNAPPNFCPCSAPILANSDASPANSNSPLANFNAFPAATDTYLGSPEPQEPPPLFLIFATHHQLNTLVPPTYSRVSQQPWGNPRSPMIPSTYQHIESRIRHQTSPPLRLHPYDGSPHGHPPQLTPNLQPLTQTVKSSPTPLLPSPPTPFSRTKLTPTSPKEQHSKTQRPPDQMSDNVSGTVTTL